MNTIRYTGRATRRLLRTLGTLFFLGGLVRVMLIILVPLYPADDVLPGYNDEPLHLHYVEHLAAGGGWPVLHPGEADVDSLKAQFVQSPLYYALSAPVWQLAESVRAGAGIYSVRILSMLFGLLAGFFCYRTALLYSGNSKVSTSALTAILFAPNAVLFTSLATNDALLICLSSVALYGIALIGRSSGHLGEQLLAAVTLGGSVWAKLSGFALFPLIWFACSRSYSMRARWVIRGRIGLLALLVVAPLLAWNLNHYGHLYPGGGEPLTKRYSPEQAVGVHGGAIHHPVMAAKIWLRTAAQPFFDRWGSHVEKASSSLWLLFWGSMTVAGAWVMIRNRSGGTLFLVSIALVLLANLWRSLNQFQVEFRLMIPAFPALAVLAATAAAQFRISLPAQIILWIAPFLLIFLY